MAAINFPHTLTTKAFFSVSRYDFSATFGSNLIAEINNYLSEMFSCWQCVGNEWQPPVQRAHCFNLKSSTESRNNQICQIFFDSSNIPAGGRGLWGSVFCRLCLSTRNHVRRAAPLSFRNLEQGHGSPKPFLLLALPSGTLLQQYWSQPTLRFLWCRQEEKYNSCRWQLS